MVDCIVILCQPQAEAKNMRGQVVQMFSTKNRDEGFMVRLYLELSTKYIVPELFTCPRHCQCFLSLFGCIRPRLLTLNGTHMPLVSMCCWSAAPSPNEEVSADTLVGAIES